MRQLLFAVAFAFPTVAFADCPVGSFPWTDNWGNQICKRFGDGSTSTIQGNFDNPGGCPTGMHPWVDGWGNKVCQSFDMPNQPSERSYDTSQGCPIGTFSWTDSWGNAVCKSF